MSKDTLILILPSRSNLLDYFLENTRRQWFAIRIGPVICVLIISQRVLDADCYNLFSKHQCVRERVNVVNVVRKSFCGRNILDSQFEAVPRSLMCDVNSCLTQSTSHSSQR